MGRQQENKKILVGSVFGATNKIYIVINGSFGVGKTSVARELRSLLPRSIIFDPELIGFFIRRTPGYAHSDYQHSKLWRHLTTRLAKLFGFGRRVVIIPMTFSRLDYLEEIRSGLSTTDSEVLHFCLVAPIEVIRERLAKRGQPETDPRWSWVHTRALECCVAHESEEFATRISASEANPKELAADLAAKAESFCSSLK